MTPINGAVINIVLAITVDQKTTRFLCGTGNNSAVQVVTTHRHALMPILFTIDISNKLFSMWLPSTKIILIIYELLFYLAQYYRDIFSLPWTGKIHMKHVTNPQNIVKLPTAYHFAFICINIWKPAKPPINSHNPIH